MHVWSRRVWSRYSVLVFDWTWDRASKSAAAEVSDNEREVRFHVNYSSGTAVAKGTQSMSDGQYFWEVKMTTPVYGTDMVRLERFIVVYILWIVGVYLEILDVIRRELVASCWSTQLLSVC